MAAVFSHESCAMDIPPPAEQQSRVPLKNRVGLKKNFLDEPQIVNSIALIILCPRHIPTKPRAQSTN